MSLPECLTTFNAAAFYNDVAKPKRFYDVVMSRPAHGMRIDEETVVWWSSVKAHRCLLSHEALITAHRDRYLVCVLREFNQLTQ